MNAGPGKKNLVFTSEPAKTVSHQIVSGNHCPHALPTLTASRVVVVSCQAYFSNDWSYLAWGLKTSVGRSAPGFCAARRLSAVSCLESCHSSCVFYPLHLSRDPMDEAPAWPSPPGTSAFAQDSCSPFVFPTPTSGGLMDANHAWPLPPSSAASVQASSISNPAFLEIDWNSRCRQACLVPRHSQPPELVVAEQAE